MKTRTYVLVGILLLMVGGWASAADVHGITGFPLTSDGWTDLVAMYQHSQNYNDSRIIYVSTSGNDATARDYSPGDGAIGRDPFNPTGPIAAYSSLAAAYGRLRDGYPDMMLLKRGDQWSENLPQWRKSGRSNAERMILGAYGSLAGSRPKIGSFTTGYGVNNPERAFSHNILVGIEFSSLDRIIFGANMLIEDCAFLSGRNTGVVLQGSGGPITNSAMRRSVVAGRYPDDTTGHTQGMYVANTTDFLLEENIFDHNGWAERSISGGEPTIYNHNTYFGVSNDRTVMRYNFSARSSSKGFQSGGGGIVHGNLSFQDPIGIESSRAETYKIGVVSEITSNVVLSPDDPKASFRTNWSLRLSNVGRSDIRDNIFADNPNPVNAHAIQIEPSERYGVDMLIRNVTIENNVFYNTSRAISLWGVYPDIENIQIVGNRFHEDRDSPIVYHSSASASEVTSSQNTFYSGASYSSWFHYAGSYLSLDNWAAILGDATSVAGPTTPNGGHSILDYLRSWGGTATLDSFYARMRAQRRGNWDPRYTAVPIVNYVRGAFGKDEIVIDYSMMTLGDGTRGLPSDNLEKPRNLRIGP